MTARNATRFIYKGAWISSEAGGERLNLPHVEMAASGQHFGDDALAANFGKILLSEIVLRHQETKHFDAGSLRRTMMLAVVRFDKHAQRFDQAIARVPGVVADFID